MTARNILATTILALCLAATAFAAPKTITGVLTDDMCTTKHMMSGVSSAECVRLCVKAGAKFAVVSNGKVYILSGMAAELNALAGKKVSVTGELNGNTMTVTSVAEAK